MSPSSALTGDAHGNLWFLGANQQLRGLLVERRARGAHLVRTRLDMHRQLGPCCANEAPKSMLIGPDGHLWFTALEFGHRHSNAAYLGTFAGGEVRLTRVHRSRLSEIAVPSGIVATKTGFWITGGDPLQDNGALWHVGVNGVQRGYDLPYDPLALTLDAAGHPWFTAIFSNRPSQIVEVLH